MSRLTLSFLLASLLAPAVQAAELVVYTERKEPLVKPLFERYERETGTKIQLLSDGAPVLIERLAAEGDNTRADLFMAVDAGSLWQAAEQRARALQHGRVREQHAVRRLAHDARGGVGGVAHARVRAALGDPDLGGKHVAPIDAQLQRQRRVGIGDPAKRAQHPALAPQSAVRQADDQPVRRRDRGGGADLPRDRNLLAVRIEHAGGSEGARGRAGPASR